MGACSSCGGCCAPCATTCGALGGASIGGMSSFFVRGSGYSGIIPFLRRHHVSQSNDDATPVDGEALVDPNHPGHREAIKVVSHVDDDKHEETVLWLKGLLQEIGHESDPQT